MLSSSMRPADILNSAIKRQCFKTAHQFPFLLSVSRRSVSKLRLNMLQNSYSSFHFPLRTGGREPVHLPPAAGVHGHGPGVHVPALRPRDLGQGVHRQADQPLQVLRLRVVRQRRLGPSGHTSHERLSNRYKETQSSIEAIERTIETVLIPKPFLVKIKKKTLQRGCILLID